MKPVSRKRYVKVVSDEKNLESIIFDFCCEVMQRWEGMYRWDTTTENAILNVRHIHQA